MAVEFLKAGTTSWVVPAGVTSVKVEVIGAGANGQNGTSSATSKGGSGGGYAVLANLAVTPGATIECFVPTQTLYNTARTTSYFMSPTIVAATSGINTNNTSINAGGDFVAGDTGFAGGAASNNRLGGGGAAGPNGIGGSSISSTGRGGGGANGGGSTATSTGGTNRNGTGGGEAAVDGVSAAGAGMNGGGGGGGANSSTALYFNGADGSQDTIWTSTVNGETAGPGGGGGSSGGSGVGGNGGGYGAGGGGSRSSATGRQQGSPSIIVLTYEAGAVAPRRGSRYFMFY